MSNLQASHILIFSFTSFYCKGEVTSSCPKSRLFLMLWTHSSPLFSTSLSWSLLSIQPSSHIPHLRKQNTSPFKFFKKIFFYVDLFKKVFIEFVIRLFLFSVLFFLFFFWPQSLWDLSSPARDRTGTSCFGRWSLDPPGKSQHCSWLHILSTHLPISQLFIHNWAPWQSCLHMPSLLAHLLWIFQLSPIYAPRPTYLLKPLLVLCLPGSQIW